MLDKATMVFSARTASAFMAARTSASLLSIKLLPAARVRSFLTSSTQHSSSCATTSRPIQTSRVQVQAPESVSTMTLQVFLDLISQPCRSVYMFVKKNELPVEVKIISMMNGDQHTEEFGKVNPLRKVPALKDGDFSMGESIPMMEYMAEKFNTADHWYPKDLQKRSRVREYLSWQHTSIRTHGSMMLYVKLMAQDIFKLEVPEHKIASAVEDLNSSLDQIENIFITEGGFIGGDQISIADLVAIVEIMQPFAVGEPVFEGRPKLSAWKERVVAAVGKELFDEAHKDIMSMKEALTQIDPSKLEPYKPRIVKLIS